jgi:hypothetical protein
MSTKKAKKEPGQKAEAAPLKRPAIGDQFTRLADKKGLCITSVDEGSVSSPEVIYFGDGSHCTFAELSTLYEPTPPVGAIENASVTVDVTKAGRYPRRTVMRELFVKFSAEEIDELSKSLADTVTELEVKLPARKKALKESQMELAMKVHAGEHETDVECEWRFECAGFDSAGAMI